jgi:hypothetical protein
LSGKVLVEDVLTKERVIVKPGKQVEIKKLPEDLEKKVKKELAKGKNVQQIKNEVGLAPLKAAPIVEEVKADIRETSAIAKNDKAFTSKKAIEVLGSPETWKLPPDEIPIDLKDIKEEF